MNIINWSKTAVRQLSKIDARYHKAIKSKVDELANYPDVILDLKKLKGRKNEYRLRVGNYRILFEVVDEVPKIIEIQAVKKRSGRTYN